jgi:hypothetical protein
MSDSKVTLQASGKTNSAVVSPLQCDDRCKSLLSLDELLQEKLENKVLLDRVTGLNRLNRVRAGP